MCKSLTKSATALQEAQDGLAAANRAADAKEVDIKAMEEVVTKNRCAQDDVMYSDACKHRACSGRSAPANARSYQLIFHDKIMHVENPLSTEFLRRS